MWYQVYIQHKCQPNWDLKYNIKETPAEFQEEIKHWTGNS